MDFLFEVDSSLLVEILLWVEVCLELKKSIVKDDVNVKVDVMETNVLFTF